MSEFKVGDRVRDEEGDVGYVSALPTGEDENYWVKYNGYTSDIPAGPAEYLTLVDDYEDSPEPDMVNHPAHYNLHPSGVECIEIVRHHNFNIGNGIKYLWRTGLKGDETTEIQDLEKAVFYIQDEIQRLRLS